MSDQVNMVYGPKSSAKEAAPQWLMQDWLGSIVANLDKRAGWPRPASTACPCMGFLQQLLWQPTSGLRKLLFSEGDRRIIKAAVTSVEITQN